MSTGSVWQPAVDYPARFRQMLARSVTVAHAALGPATPEHINLEQRTRVLHTLAMALHVDGAWPATAALLLAVAPAMELHALRQEWFPYLEGALRCAVARADALCEAQLRLWLGRSCHSVARLEEALTHLDCALAIARRLGERTVEVAVLERQTMIVVERLDIPQALALVDETLNLVGRDSPLAAQCHHILGFIAVHQKRSAEAIAHYTKALALRQMAGDGQRIILAERDLAFAYENMGDYPAARVLHRKVLGAYQQRDNPYGEALSCGSLAMLDWHEGRFAEALAWMDQAEPVLAKVGNQAHLARYYNNRGLILTSLARYREAEAALALSVAFYREQGDPVRMANALDTLAGCYLAQGDKVRAHATLQEALALLVGVPAPPRLFVEMIEETMRKVGEEGTT